MKYYSSTLSHKEHKVEVELTPIEERYAASLAKGNTSRVPEMRKMLLAEKRDTQPAVEQDEKIVDKKLFGGTSDDIAEGIRQMIRIKGNV